MLLKIPGVLDADKLANIRAVLEKVEFVDGKFSAGKFAAPEKHNLEMKQGTRQAEYLDHLLMGSLAEHPLFRSAALPYRVAQPVFARYLPGMRYGDHVDDPIMGSGPAKFRTDVSLTVFLNEPDDYAGGELIIHTTFGEQAVKLAAGAAVLYPASSVHRVAEVTRGERLVGIVWLQSLVRDPAQRELLFELDQARTHLRETQPESVATRQVDRAYVNLVRRWSEV